MNGLNPRRILRCCLSLVCGVVSLTVTTRGAAQLTGTFNNWRDHPAINYNAASATDRVASLNREIENGRQLAFDGPSGYLRSTLAALGISLESQITVFVRDSAQALRISPGNPRSIFFNDSVAVGWVRGGFIELAAQDPRQGVVFYTLELTKVDAPRFHRRDDCLSCHFSYATVGIPGMLVRSSGEFSVNHTLPIDRRWAGWYVTSRTASHHLGNIPLDVRPEHAPLSTPLASLADRFDTTGYLSTHSDIVALMVFDHQMHGLNLLTRIGWEARVAAHVPSPPNLPDGSSANDVTTSMADAAREVVDYLLFIDEAPLKERVEGTSGFAEKFEAQGPRDTRGRSLREFNLVTRLMRYPCSYLIYSEVFDALPSAAKEAIYARMMQVLTGREKEPRYQRLSAADRTAILEILKDTKPGFPIAH